MLRKFRRISLVVLIVGSLFVSLPRGAFACSCMMPPEPKAALDMADAVFAGKVVSIVDRKSVQWFDSTDSLLVTFQVTTVWKGDAKPALSISTARDGAACGYSFHPGRDYMVYANEFEGALSSTICSRTALLMDAGSDLLFLGEGQPVAQPAQPPLVMPLLTGGLVVAAVLALVLFASGLFTVQSKQE